MSLRNNFLSATFTLLLIIVCSCTKPEQTLRLNIPLSEISDTKGSQFIYVDASGKWTISLDFGDAEPWARIDTPGGVGNVSGITLSWDANPGASRNCNIILKGNGSSTQKFLKQKANANFTPTDYPHKAEAQWLELPATDDNELIFITHDMSIGSKTMRNWSCYYDSKARLSRWVAYPLNDKLIGPSTGRSDAWSYDPSISTTLQPTLAYGYRGGYDRGHQLPSADRQYVEANRSTFYYTNMTPQKNSLNAHAWASLEGMVRNWSRDVDTLYVVTGADVQGGKYSATDNNGHQCLVPSGYFKALLAYKKGSFNLTGGYAGIAFYFEHKSYTDTHSAVMAQKMSIDELEKKIGTDFFVNLSSKIGDTLTDKVESNIDSWWY